MSMKYTTSNCEYRDGQGCPDSGPAEHRAGTSTWAPGRPCLRISWHRSAAWGGPAPASGARLHATCHLVTASSETPKVHGRAVRAACPRRHQAGQLPGCLDRERANINPFACRLLTCNPERLTTIWHRITQAERCRHVRHHYERTRTAPVLGIARDGSVPNLRRSLVPQTG